MVKRRASTGFSLIELLVAMAIGLILTLAITTVLIASEGQKRTTTTVNDMNKTGAFASFTLDRLTRSAGSGFTQAWNLGAFGCQLGVKKNGSVILPRPSPSAFPEPFAGFGGGSGVIRVAPVLIGMSQSKAGSDVLMVMSGSAASGDVPRPVRSLVGSTDLRLDNTLGFQQGDITLLTQNGTADCLLEQVQGATPANGTPTVFSGSSAVDQLPLAGTYYADTAATTDLATFAASGSAYLSVLGSSANLPQMQLLGVGDNYSLYAYDLLRPTTTDASQAIADGVAGLYAIYGLDTDNNGVIDSWVTPDATSGWDLTALSAAPAKLRQIVAIRTALVLRSQDGNKTEVTPTSLTLFTGPGMPAGVSRTVNLSHNAGDINSDVHYRYRVIETTTPLRNMMTLPIS